MKILIVEDDQSLGSSMVEYLMNADMIVEYAENFDNAEEKISWYEYDIIILDIGLPDGNGIDLLKILKKEKSKAGVLIVSAKDSLNDKILGLNLGADDYITKPFHLSELNARINALYRRKFLQGNTTVKFYEIEIDVASHFVTINSQELDLSKKEYMLLLYFITNSNKVLTKSTIAEHLWGDYMDVADNHDLVYSHLKNLRKKIAKYSDENYIQTIYGVGYKCGDLK